MSSVVSPLILLSLGGLGLGSGGVNGVAVTLLVIGGGLGAITLLDYPRRVEFGPTGITRVCLLRRHDLPWSDVRALQRARGSLLSYVRLRNMGDAPTAPRVPSGGLVARGSSGRRWLLCDRIESQPEFDAIKRVCTEHGSHVVISAARPSATSPPTTALRPGVPNAVDQDGNTGP